MVINLNELNEKDSYIYFKIKNSLEIKEIIKNNKILFYIFKLYTLIIQKNN